MNVKYFVAFFLFAGISFFGCGLNDNVAIENSTKNSVVAKSPEIYGIKGEEMFLRAGPGDKHEKLINKKATEALKEKHYLQVDYTVKVRILETDGDWSKIQVVDPEWLSATHIGWIPTKNILKGSSNDVKSTKLGSKDYEILKTNHNSSVQNFYVLIKQKNLNKESVFEFTKSFRAEHCKMNCNVHVYDSQTILPLLDKYPLEAKEYLTLADHFVSMSTFDAPEVKSWYPFQDFKYKEYGGKNWKKEPIK